VLLGDLLSQKILFVNVVNTRSLIAVQWTYLASAFFTVLLALCFYYMPLPEATDSDLQIQAERLTITPSEILWQITYHFHHFGYGHIVDELFKWSMGMP
jgi:hypothetical protein